MSSALPFEQVARLPASGDNVAIAVRRLEAGTVIKGRGSHFTLPFSILEGHRFAVTPIRGEAALLSWGMPFGFALHDIAPGQYVCNEKILRALHQRHVDFPLPTAANFRDYYIRFQLDPSKIRAGSQVEPYDNPGTFSGFPREGGRGVGTRNYVAILGTTSRTASYARALADRFKTIGAEFGNIDGVVAIAHTEGGSETPPNNIAFILRTLAGFFVHPNIAAILAVDLGTEYVNNAQLRAFMIENNYPLDAVAHQFWTMPSNFLPALDEGEKIVRSWLPLANEFQRSPQPLEHLKIGLQCGGSDEFSGVSGNPLVGLVSRELIRNGGSANLAETDELIGAEPYILANVKDLDTARAFLEKIERFQERAGWHGHTGEGNPSGGNNFRGLYNIAIKSLGAARKKDPEVRIDYVIDYAVPMHEPGFYFMDSPGNDLESIAGQVGSGSNLILFTTGNGSITNFPFVPTIKVMTSTGRFNLLSHEMDVNAGRYLDGVPMEQLARESFDLTIRVASGARSVGEKAGHSQVQLWRDWRQTDRSRLDALLHVAKPNGEPIPLAPAHSDPPQDSHFEFLKTETGLTSDQIGLIIPTSLCAGQVGKVIADKLNAEHVPGPGSKVTRYVALAHTEGCGVSSGESEEISLRTMAGYLCHPLVRRGLLLEHGCEKTHNDALREYFERHGIDYTRFGMASVQLDGGLDKVTEKVVNWFLADTTPGVRKQQAGLASARIALTVESNTPDYLLAGAGALTSRIVRLGGTVVIPENSPLLTNPLFLEPLLGGVSLPPASLEYGERFSKPGFHVMQSPTAHAVETLTGLGATGVEVMLVSVTKAPWQGHTMVPVLQVAGATLSNDLDAVLSPAAPETIATELLSLLTQVLSREYKPKLFVAGNTDFQMTRGLLGVSL